MSSPSNLTITKCKQLQEVSLDFFLVRMPVAILRFCRMLQLQRVLGRFCTVTRLLCMSAASNPKHSQMTAGLFFLEIKSSNSASGSAEAIFKTRLF